MFLVFSDDFEGRRRQSCVVGAARGVSSEGHAFDWRDRGAHAQPTSVVASAAHQREDPDVAPPHVTCSLPPRTPRQCLANQGDY